MVLEKKIFLSSSIYVRYFVIIFPLEKCDHIFEQTLISITQECFVPSVAEIWLWGSREEDFSISSIYFRYFVITFPWKWGWPFGQHLIPFAQKCFVPSLKLAFLFSRSRVLKFVNVFSLFRYYLPYKKGVILHLNKTWIPITQIYTLCQVCLKLTQWF